MSEVGFHLCCGDGDDVQGNAQTRALRHTKEMQIHELKKSDDPADIALAEKLRDEIDSEVKVMRSYMYVQVAAAICCLVIPLTLMGLMLSRAP